MCPSNKIKTHLLTTYSGVVCIQTWGEEAFFYNPGNLKPKGIYFVTLKERNGPNDRASHLDREGVYRLNLGLAKEDYLQMFGSPPSRPPKGGVVLTGHDFTACDIITPHPIYGWMHWISVINPSDNTLNLLNPLLDNAYALAKHKFEKSSKQS